MSLLIVTSAESAPVPFDPNRPIRLSGSHLGTTVVVSKTCSGCDLAVRSVHGDSVANFKLRSSITEPTDLKVVSPSIAVVAGWATSFASGVTIFDPATGTKVDEFVCYRPSLSPTGRYVAFVRFYQQHGPASVGTSDTVAVYDTARSTVNERAGRGSEDEGTLAYPQAANDGIVHRLQTPIVWTSRDGFSFIELAAGRPNEVRVTIDNGIPASSVRPAPAPTAAGHRS